VETCLSQFESLATPGPLAIPWTSHFPGEERIKTHLVLGFITHGNEWGTLPAALRVLAELKTGHLKSAGPITFLLGNPRATRKNVRFVDEDFNRVFSFERPADNGERQRAEEVRPLLDSADIFLDFHQTQTPTESPFWTFPWDEAHAHWAQIIAAAPLGLTRPPGGVFSKGKCCLDEYVRNRGKIGLTAEVGTKGADKVQEELTYQSIVRLLSALERIEVENCSLQELAEVAPPVQWYQTAEVVAARTKDDRLRDGLGNWSSVDQGEILSAPGGPLLRASQSGKILFPKYPQPGEPLAPELFRLGTPLENPSEFFEK